MRGAHNNGLDLFTTVSHCEDMSAYRIRPPPCPPPNRPSMSADEVGHIMSKVYTVIGVLALVCVITVVRHQAQDPSTKLYLTALSFRVRAWLGGSQTTPAIVAARDVAAPTRKSRRDQHGSSGGGSLKFGAGGERAKPGRAKASGSGSGGGGGSRKKKSQMEEQGTSEEEEEQMLPRKPRRKR